jgi:hypothetical protein
MIEVARTAAARDAASTIDWRTGDAAALAFEHDVFDVVVCQQDVQFFPIVSRHCGRCAGSFAEVDGWPLPCGVQSRITPYQAALADALRRRVSPEAGSMARAPCALCDAVELHGLVASAGFRYVRVRPTIAMTKLPLPDQFVPGHLAALPMAQAIARLAPDRRAALLAEMTETLRPYVDGEQVIIPAGVNVATADA